MADYSIQMIMQMTSGVAEDAVSNTWAVTADDLTAATAAKDEIVDFYRDIVSVLPNLVAQTGHVWKIVDRSDPAPQYPRAEGTWTFAAAPTGAPAPPEVCVCLSFEATRSPGQPQARRRGRVYIGPLDVSTIHTDGRPTTGLTSTIAVAADTLWDSSVASATWDWVVWSTVNGSGAPVQNGWVDNEFDTQRRRGRRPTTRDVFPP